MTLAAPPVFVQFRQELHQFPELSGQELQTQQRIKDFVSQFKPATLQAIGGTGLLVRYGQAGRGPVTLIRADIDALPIYERNQFAHRSIRDGVSHKCGHDGHATILTRLASHLAATPINGCVYLVFQPAEETGQGAAAILKDPVFNDVHPDYVFALHNLPGYPVGTVVCRPGSFTSSVLSLICTFTGKVSHSAEPENGINPAYVMAEFLLRTKLLQQPDAVADDFALITPIFTALGEKSYGVSAGYGEVHLTLRTRQANRMTALTAQIQTLLTELSTAASIDSTVQHTEAFFANENDAEAVAQIKQAALQLGHSYVETSAPFKWGEDFGLFTQHYPGAMFGNGIDSPALHNDDYDFNDGLIEPAAQLFLALLKRRHGTDPT